MRSKKQVALRQKRVVIANELLLWIEASGKTEGYLAYPVVGQFAREKGCGVFEVWKAWDLLKEAGRLNRDQRHGWELLESTPIQIDANGDLMGLPTPESKEVNR